MTDHLSILIVEDDDILAANLAVAVEDRDAQVVGPASTVADALEALKCNDVGGAILDASLPDRDVTPVAMSLIDKGIPFLIHTGVGLPAEIATVFPHVSVVMKPADPDEVVAQLLGQVNALGRLATDAPRATGQVIGAEPDRTRDIGRIASALYDQFGEKAIVLARRQAAVAAGEPQISWAEIIAALEDKKRGS